MSLADDISRDYLFFDGVVDVTIKDGDTNILEDDPTTAKALPTAVDAMDLALLGSLAPDSETTVWSVFNATMQGKTIRKGFSITDSDDVVWIVNSVSRRTLGTR